MESREPNSITYWESRQVNVGDYESISFGATVITKFVTINQKEKKAEVFATETRSIYPDMTEGEAFTCAQANVRTLLDSREKEIRLASNTNGNTSFDTLKKAMDFKIVTDTDIGLTDTDLAPTSTTKPKAGANEHLDDFDDFDTPSKPVNTKAVKPPKAGFVKKTPTTGLFAAGKPGQLKEPIKAVEDWETGDEPDVPI